MAKEYVRHYEMLRPQAEIIQPFPADPITPPQRARGASTTPSARTYPELASLPAGAIDPCKSSRRPARISWPGPQGRCSAAAWSARLSIGTLQLSIRCSSIHFLPSRSLPVSPAGRSEGCVTAPRRRISGRQPVLSRCRRGRKAREQQDEHHWRWKPASAPRRGLPWDTTPTVSDRWNYIWIVSPGAEPGAHRLVLADGTPARAGFAVSAE